MDAAFLIIADIFLQKKTAIRKSQSNLNGSGSKTSPCEVYKDCVCGFLV